MKAMFLRESLIITKYFGFKKGGYYENRNEMVRKIVFLVMLCILVVPDKQDMD